jgi:hypothetical protein
MNEWSDFEKYVFAQLAKMSAQIEGISEQVWKLRGQAAIWGAIAGAAGVALFEILFKSLGH